jgi:hypothetical protein
MTHIIAYTYEAGTHCLNCAKRRDMASGFRIDKDRPRAHQLDENGIPYGATDREGNSVHPIFSTDETSAQIARSDGGHDLTCDTCLEVIEPHFDGAS